MVSGMLFIVVFDAGFLSFVPDTVDRDGSKVSFNLITSKVAIV